MRVILALPQSRVHDFLPTAVRVREIKPPSRLKHRFRNFLSVLPLLTPWSFTRSAIPTLRALELLEYSLIFGLSLAGGRPSVKRLDRRNSDISPDYLERCFSRDVRSCLHEEATPVVAGMLFHVNSDVLLMSQPLPEVGRLLQKFNPKSQLRLTLRESRTN